jgi:hypothetical protein
MRSRLVWLPMCVVVASCGSNAAPTSDGPAAAQDGGSDVVANSSDERPTAPVEAGPAVDAATDVSSGPLCQGEPLPIGSHDPFGMCPDSDPQYAWMSVCMTCDGLRSHPECLPYCSFYSECYRCGPRGWSFGSFDCARNCGDGGVALPPADVAVDVPVTPKDAAVDAGECRGDSTALATSGWSEPCPALVDAGVPSLTCAGRSPGLRVYTSFCEQREVLIWDWQTHAQTCFYEQGTLRGVKLTNDTPAFCNNTSFALGIGATDGCPSAKQTRVLDCNPFADADWIPWAPDAR